MTAIVGILNKSGIAIAADSAATISNSRGRKVLNTETKIFRLSKKYPVSVMVYGSTTLMGTPWELIIKQYCRKCGNKGRDTLKEYVDDFLKFLREEEYFCNKEAQDGRLQNMLIDFYQTVRDLVKEDFEEQDGKEQVSYNELFLDRLEGLKQSFSTEPRKCPELEKYPFRTFQSKAKKAIDDIITYGFAEEGFAAKQRLLFEQSAYEWIKSVTFLGDFNTGLVFSGYGENDIFPCLYPIEVAGVMDDRLRYFVNERRIAQIGNDNVATIAPFAQVDVMQTFMDGIAPDLRDYVIEGNEQLINQTQTRIYNKLVEAGIGQETLELVANIDFDEISEQAQTEFSKYIQNEKREGLLDAVEMFNVQELASMAENLVSITNLQRHFISGEETVGGPVDVAVITRNEGFVWIKRKQWFDYELNRRSLNDEL